MTYSILVKTWVPAKKRKLKSGKVVDVKGYYDPRSPKRGYMVANDNWVMASKNRDDWMIPVSRPSMDFSGENAGAVRDEARMYGMNVVRGVYNNHETKWPIHVTALGIKKVLGHSAALNQCLAIPAIPDMLLHSSFSKISLPTKDKHKGKEVIFWSAHCPVCIRGKIYIAKIVIKYMNKNFTFYDYDLSKEVSADDLSSRSGHKPGGDSSSTLAMSIRDLSKYASADGSVLKKSHLILGRKKNSSPLYIRPEKSGQR